VLARPICRAGRPPALRVRRGGEPGRRSARRLARLCAQPRHPSDGPGTARDHAVLNVPLRARRTTICSRTRLLARVSLQAWRRMSHVRSTRTNLASDALAGRGAALHLRRCGAGAVAESSPGCARSRTRRATFRTAAPSSTSTAAQRDSRITRLARRHRAARGARRHAARAGAHARHRALLPAESKVVKVERRTPDAASALLPEQLSALAQHYDISLGETRRVAASTARRDAHAEGQPALRLPPVRRTASACWCARSRSTPGNQIEQFMFTQLTIGRVTPTCEVAPRGGFRVEDAERPTRLAGWACHRAAASTRSSN